MVGHVQDLLDDGQAGASAVDLQADLLAIVRGEPAQFIERTADLRGGSLLGNAFGQVVRLDLHAAAAAIVAELDESLGRLDGLAQGLRIDVMETLVAADAEEEHRTLGKSFLDFLPLRGADTRLDAVLVLGT